MLNTAAIKAFITTKFITDPAITEAFLDLDGNNTIPPAYANPANWKRTDKYRIKNAADFDNRYDELRGDYELGADPLRGAAYTVRCFVHCATDETRDTVITVITDAADNNIVFASTISD